ncbi:MAG: hypothetical protein ACPGVU_03780 [Limisphaerales bacterium]
MKNRALVWKITGTIVVVLMSWVVLEMVAGARRLEGARASLKHKGEPMTWREIVPPVSPGAFNGEMEFLAAVDGIEELPKGLLTDRFPVHGEKIPLARYGAIPTELREQGAAGSRRRWASNIWLELRPIVQRGQLNWEHARAAATNELIRIGLNWDRGVHLTLTHLRGQRHLFEWIHAAVVMDLHDGDREAALEKVITGFRLLEIFDEPSLISALVRVACVRRLSAATWELLQTDGWSDSQLSRLQTAVSSVRFVDSFDRAQQMERCVAELAWREAVRDSSAFDRLGGLPGDSAIVPMWRALLSSRDLAWYLENHQSQLEQGRAGVKAKSLVAHNAAFAAGTERPPMYYLISRTFSLFVETSLKKAFVAENEREMTITVIALERFRLKQGRYPERLEQLVPDWLKEGSVDWMNGGVLHFERLADDDFRLWSVGQDGVDDGGDPTISGTPSGPHPHDGRDWVWLRASAPTDVQIFIKKQEAEMKAATKP